MSSSDSLLMLGPSPRGHNSNSNKALIDAAAASKGGGGSSAALKGVPHSRVPPRSVYYYSEVTLQQGPHSSSIRTPPPARAARPHRSGSIRRAPYKPPTASNSSRRCNEKRRHTSIYRPQRPHGLPWTRLNSCAHSARSSSIGCCASSSVGRPQRRPHRPPPLQQQQQ